MPKQLPPETVALRARIKQMWEGEGLSARQIGRVEHMTRNAVLGHVKRMGLSTRAGVVRNAYISTGFVKKKPKPVPVVVPDKTPEMLGAVGVSLGLAVCQYIDGNPPTPNWRMCGQPRANLGSYYCGFHHQICHHKPNAGAA